jgi:hypothetical protein
MKKVTKQNCLANKFPDIAKQWHPTLNGDLTPEKVNYGSGYRAHWQCEKDETHVWSIGINVRVNGNSCPYCSNQKVCKSNSFATTHPELISEWHPTLNHPLTPFDLVAGSSRKKFWWMCQYNHTWQSTVRDRALIGCGCPYCSNKIVSDSNCLAITHPEIAKQWHPTLNGNLTPYHVTYGSHKKVWWFCDKEKDHVYENSIKNKVKSDICSCCVNRKIVLSNCLVTTNDELIKEWDWDKNDIDPFKIGKGSHLKVWWKHEIDNKIHSWKASIAHRVNGRNCPICKESKGEKSIASYLDSNHIDYIREFRFNKESDIKLYRFDFAIFKNETMKLIEFHGQQHYLPASFKKLPHVEQEKLFKKCQDRDSKKEDFCKKKNIPLLIIPYWEQENISSILDNWLSIV